MLTFVKCPIGMGGKMNKDIFHDIYAGIEPFLKEVKKGFLKKSKEVDIKSFKPNSKVSNFTGDFQPNVLPWLNNQAYLWRRGCIFE